MGRKFGGLCPLFGERGWVPISYKVPWVEAHLPTKWRLDASSCLVIIEMSQKWGGGSTPFLGKGAGYPSNIKSPGPKSASIPSGILIHAAIWLQHIRAKNWGLCPPFGGGAGSPSNTMWPGPRPTCVPSFILIRPTVWPHYTLHRYTEDRQTGQTTV